MSESNLQVLLHEGELLYITHIIEKTRSDFQFVGGCLFGLWRNSLKQPVIQFVTGPSKEFRQNFGLEAICSSEYNKKCEDILDKGHAMLKLGYWFYGPDDIKEQVKKNFSSSYDVLLFISLIDQKLLGEFFLKKDKNEEWSTLCKEDVLPGNSSFRIYQPLTDAVDKGAEFRSLNKDDPHQALSTYICELPSRLQVRDPETKKEQWYSSENGMHLLQTLVQYLNSASSVQVEMSRDATTHNIQFNLEGGYCLDFPVDFPKYMPDFYDPRGNQIDVRYQRGDDVCRTVVDAVRPYCKRGSRP